jgi:hypothetical protein
MRRRTRVGIAQPASPTVPALLHLDKGESPTLERHEVDLADRHLVTAGEGAMALRPSKSAAMVSTGRADRP